METQSTRLSNRAHGGQTQRAQRTAASGFFVCSESALYGLCVLCSLARFRKSPASHLDPQRASEATSGIIRFRAVVIDEECPIAAIHEERAAALANGRRGEDYYVDHSAPPPPCSPAPLRRLRIIGESSLAARAGSGSIGGRWRPKTDGRPVEN